MNQSETRRSDKREERRERTKEAMRRGAERGNERPGSSTHQKMVAITAEERRKSLKIMRKVVLMVWKKE